MKSKKEFLKWLFQPSKDTIPDGYYHGFLVYKADNSKNKNNINLNSNIKNNEDNECR